MIFYIGAETTMLFEAGSTRAGTTGRTGMWATSTCFPLLRSTVSKNNNIEDQWVENIMSLIGRKRMLFNEYKHL